MTGPLLVAIALATGCASTASRQPVNRQFHLEQDSFAYVNGLLWVYEPDPASGKMTTHSREPKPDYHHECFVMARAARQFFDFARFEPEARKLDTAGYRARIDEVLSRDPRSDPARREPVVVPGYANLHEFSRDYEALLKERCGGAWQSFVQRGHWRIVFPFTDRHQERLVKRVQRELARGLVPVLHLVRFPQLTINHAVLVYATEESSGEVRFLCYDPNDSSQPLVITYRESDRRFHIPQNNYFIGGRVDLYEVYRNWLY